jgi:tRNA U34 5-methylaminomethyl-2-thiouridine-forming methyltransferase MnmC
MEEWGETYHSIHGAVQEAMHVYLQNGYYKVDKPSIQILEMGFGTGLNAYLTFLEAIKTNRQIEYHSVEGFPLSKEEFSCLNYKTLTLDKVEQDVFDKMHNVAWESLEKVHNQFTLKKIHSSFQEVQLPQQYYDLIYFDAFGYPFQPELWTEEIFQKMFDSLKQGGVLVTYACRTVIKKAMKNAGFEVEVCAGPPGKREMSIAYKR